MVYVFKVFSAIAKFVVCYRGIVLSPSHIAPSCVVQEVTLLALYVREAINEKKTKLREVIADGERTVMPKR